MTCAPVTSSEAVRPTKSVTAALHRAVVGLGSNLAQPRGQLVRALGALDALPRSRVIARSACYRTAPVGYEDQPDFVNAVVMLETELSPRDLLAALLDIERGQGRVRAAPNGPRTLDLDLLVYDDRHIDEPGLTVPHPRMHERAFVMVPLAEIAPDMALPGRNESVRDLAWRLAGLQRVSRDDAVELA